MKFPLTLLDRLLFANFLPPKDSFENLTLKGDILNKVQISQDEIVHYGIKSENGQIKWAPTDSVFVTDFSEAEVNYVREVLRGLSSRKELLDEQKSLYDFFVNEKGAINDIPTKGPKDVKAQK